MRPEDIFIFRCNQYRSERIIQGNLEILYYNLSKLQVGGKVTMAKWVYMFTEGNADMRNLLGGKRRKPGCKESLGGGEGERGEEERGGGGRGIGCSGARASMPGMMDTILNLGLTKKLLRHCTGFRQPTLGLGLLQKIHSDVL